jgi:hypothetical protein
MLHSFVQLGAPSVECLTGIFRLVRRSVDHGVNLISSASTFQHLETGGFFLFFIVFCVELCKHVIEIFRIIFKNLRGENFLDECFIFDFILFKLSQRISHHIKLVLELLRGPNISLASLFVLHLNLNNILEFDI